MLPATAKVTAAGALGRCVEVRIERAASGAERLAGAKVTAEALGACR